MVSLLNFQTELPVIPVAAKVSLRAPGKVKSLVAVPENRPLDFSVEPNGMLTFAVASIDPLAMLIAEYD
jgi:hypothetical protein